MPTDKAKRISYSELIKILLSKDESVMKENEWIWDGENRFLDGKDVLNSPEIANHI